MANHSVQKKTPESHNTDIRSHSLPIQTFPSLNHHRFLSDHNALADQGSGSFTQMLGCDSSSTDSPQKRTRALSQNEIGSCSYNPIDNDPDIYQTGAFCHNNQSDSSLTKDAHQQTWNKPHEYFNSLSSLIDLPSIILALNLETEFDSFFLSLVEVCKLLFSASRVSISMPTDTADIYNCVWGSKAIWNEDVVKLTFSNVLGNGHKDTSSQVNNHSRFAFNKNTSTERHNDIPTSLKNPETVDSNGTNIMQMMDFIFYN